MVQHAARQEWPMEGRESPSVHKTSNSVPTLSDAELGLTLMPEEEDEEAQAAANLSFPLFVVSFFLVALFLLLTVLAVVRLLRGNDGRPSYLSERPSCIIQACNSPCSGFAPKNC